MTVLREVEGVRRAVANARAKGLSVGLVPTMGALHEGHVSLIRAARQECGLVVVWLFVNPTQFGPHEDLTRYPRPFEKDSELCQREGVDRLFAPAASEVYPSGFRTFVEVEGLQDVLEGKSRPGHFRGVCTVVLKMLNMVAPDMAYFGQKDAQQVIVVRRMLRDLNMGVRVRICPTVREPDGLALSSRNQYLSVVEREQAIVLHRALCAGRDSILAGEHNGDAVGQTMERVVETVPAARLDYSAVVDAETLQPLTKLAGTVLLAIAVRLGTTRLIDNRVLHVTDQGSSELPVLSDQE
jgi:pantoate--beta-alanine ligase